MEILDAILPAIENFRVFSYLIIFFVSILESLAFIGFTIPGTVVIIATGYLTHEGVLKLEPLFLSVFLGVMAGEGLSFYLGRKGVNIFNGENKIFNTKYLEKAMVFFENHGGKSILVGRFIGLFRPVLPFVAGMAKMGRRKFILITSVSVFVWTAFYLFLGYFFGEAIGRIERISHRTSIILGMLVFLGFIMFFIKKYVKGKNGKNLD